jgi:DNA-directed RNA polymerase subunit RPC12/RpoP
MSVDAGKGIPEFPAVTHRRAWIRFPRLRMREDHQTTEAPCPRCGCKMKVVRSISRLGVMLPPMRLFQCTDCGYTVLLEGHAQEEKRP